MSGIEQIVGAVVIFYFGLSSGIVLTLFVWRRSDRAAVDRLTATKEET